MSKVKLYTRTVCPKCMLVKSMFDENGIGYETINLDHDEESKKLITDKGFMSVPIANCEDEFYDFTQIMDKIDDLK